MADNASGYPGALDTFTALAALMSSVPIHSDDHKKIRDAIVKLETELGTDPRGAQATVKARLNLYDQATTTWSSPVAGGITTTSGTTTASYHKLGKQITASFKFALGASSAITGDVSLTMPVAAAVSHTPLGYGWLFDTSPAAAYPIVFVSTSTTTCALRAINTASTYGVAANLSSTIPFTWTTGDMIIATFIYFST